MLICKRVAALAGDKVKNGGVIPRGSGWLLGDNYNNSTDSRDLGPVPIGLIIGKAIFKVKINLKLLY